MSGAGSCIHLSQELLVFGSCVLHVHCLTCFRMHTADWIYTTHCVAVWAERVGSLHGVVFCAMFVLMHRFYGRIVFNVAIHCALVFHFMLVCSFGMMGICQEMAMTSGSCIFCFCVNVVFADVLMCGLALLPVRFSSQGRCSAVATELWFAPRCLPWSPCAFVGKHKVVQDHAHDCPSVRLQQEQIKIDKSRDELTHCISKSKVADDELHVAETCLSIGVMHNVQLLSTIQRLVRFNDVLMKSVSNVEIPETNSKLVTDTIALDVKEASSSRKPSATQDHTCVRGGKPSLR